MDNTVDALKTLYVALGGDADDVAEINLIPDMIIKLATVAETVAENATKKELPTVTATDNGSVLKVIEGAWAVGTDEIQA